MNKEEFIGKLQMVYVGDRNAIEEIISEYDRLNNIINGLEKWLNEDEYFNGRKLKKDYITVLVTDVLDKLKALKEDNK